MSDVDDDARRLFAHIAAAEQLYLERLLGSDPFPQDFWPVLTTAVAGRLARESVDAFLAVIADADERWLREAVRYRNSRGTYFETPREQLVIHVALHGEHHRGQIARLVRVAGGEPAVTDFIAFAREGAS